MKNRKIVKIPLFYIYQQQLFSSFTQSNSLMVHVKSHLSNKPHQCNLCNKGFLNASSLALHQKTHTGPMLTVICPIEECRKEFRDNNLLEEHMMTHRHSMLYQCSLCSEKFEQSCVLVQHVKVIIVQLSSSQFLTDIFFLK